MKGVGCITETATLKIKINKLINLKKKLATIYNFTIYIRPFHSIADTGISITAALSFWNRKNLNHFHMLQHVYPTYTSTLTLLYKLDSNFPTEPFTQIMWWPPLSTLPDFDIQITSFFVPPPQPDYYRTNNFLVYKLADKLLPVQFNL